MSNFIKTQRSTTPEQLVRLAHRALVDLFDEASSASNEDLCKRLAQLKVILYGGTTDGDRPDVDEEKALEVSRRIQEEGLILQLIEKLEVIPFEARKDTAQIFNNLMHKNISNFVTYISDHFYVVKQIARGYECTDIALCCGAMLRECIRYEELTRQILQPDDTFLWLFFDSYVHLPNFDISSDAFNTLRDVLVSARNKQIASDFLEQRYSEVFQKYEILLGSDNYVTRRRSLKLLGELLLDRSNFNVMMRFIASEHNLQVVMNLLRDKSANIQFEAFHVFKVFVANPNKPAKIRLILYKNKQKLCTYLVNFHQDKEGDDSQFSEEKKLLIATLNALERPSSEEIRQEMSKNITAHPTTTEDTNPSTDKSTAHQEPHHQEKEQEQTQQVPAQDSVPSSTGNKGYLRDALAGTAPLPSTSTVPERDSSEGDNDRDLSSRRTGVLLDESENQPMSSSLPPPCLFSESNTSEQENEWHLQQLNLHSGTSENSLKDTNS